MSCGAWGYAVFPPSVRRSSTPLRLCFILDLRCLISCECLSPRRRRSIFISPLKSLTANVAEDQISACHAELASSPTFAAGYWQPYSQGGSILLSAPVDVFHDQSSEPETLNKATSEQKPCSKLCPFQRLNQFRDVAIH